jgi:hypothetical protein
MGIPSRYDLIKYQKGASVDLTYDQVPGMKDGETAKFYYIADHTDGRKILLATNAFPDFAFKTWPMDMVPKFAIDMAFGIIERFKLTTCWWVDKKEFDDLYKEQHGKAL